MMWLTSELDSICSRRDLTVVDFDWCRFGRPWRKRTRLAGTLPGLATLGRRCEGGHEHVILQGNTTDQHGRSVPRTALAAEYSPEFAQELCHLATLAPGRPRLTADAAVDGIIRAGSSMLLWGSQERDLAGHPRLSHLGLAPDETCASASRTSPSSATPTACQL